MSIKAENLVEVSNLKAGQRVIQVDGKWVTVGVGGITGSSGEPESPTMDLSFVTATADKILTGYTGSDQQGNEVPGTMPVSTVTETSEKVTVTKGYLNENKEFAVSSGVNTSDADVEDTDLTMGSIAYGKDGKVYGSRKYVEDGTVYFNKGKLCTMEPVFLDPDNPVTIYSFDVHTDPTYKAYVGGGLVTGMMQKLDVGFLIIQQGGILDIPCIGYFEYASMDMKTIPGIGDLAAENIAYGKTICGITGTYGGAIPGNQNNYVIPNDFNQNVKIVFWKNYKPVSTNLCSFGGGVGDSRWWSSVSGSDLTLILMHTSRWEIRVTSDSPVIAYNNTLQKHEWSVPQGLDIDTDYVTIEDASWTSGPITDTES